MVEAPSSKISVLDLKRDLVPVVWKLSMLQGVSTDRMTGQITSKELAQVIVGKRPSGTATHLIFAKKRALLRQ